MATAALRAMHLEWLVRIQAGTFPDNMLVIFLGNLREMSKECLKIGHNRFLPNSVQSNRIVQYQKIIPCYTAVNTQQINKLIKKLRTRLRVFTNSVVRSVGHMARPGSTGQ